MNDLYQSIKDKLISRTKQIESLDEWLFVTVNTMKAIVDNSNKDEIDIVVQVADLQDTEQLQRFYDMIQGKYGREGFSYRNDERYYYLSSIVAKYPPTELSEKDRENVRGYIDYNHFFLYEL